MSNAPWAVLLLVTKYSLFDAIVLPKSLWELSGVTPFQAAGATLPLRQLPTDIPAWFRGDGCKCVSGSCCSAWMVRAEVGVDVLLCIRLTEVIVEKDERYRRLCAVVGRENF